MTGDGGVQLTWAQWQEYAAVGAEELERRREAEGIDLRMPQLWDGDQA